MDALGQVSRIPQPIQQPTQQKPREVEEKKPTEEVQQAEAAQKAEEQKKQDAGALSVQA